MRPSIDHHFSSFCVLVTNYTFWSRGESVEYDESYMVGEEEAIWLLRLLLPYINELLLKIRALFSGDPATTMKARKSLASSLCVFSHLFSYHPCSFLTPVNSCRSGSWLCYFSSWPGVETPSPFGPSRDCVSFWISTEGFKFQVTMQ